MVELILGWTLPPERPSRHPVGTSDSPAALPWRSEFLPSALNGYGSRKKGLTFGNTGEAHEGEPHQIETVRISNLGRGRSTLAQPGSCPG
jgi:hypothetical protein